MHRKFIFFSSLLFVLAACNRGFNLTEDESSSNDTIFRGPTAAASWRLVLDEDGESFRLQKRSSPSSEDNIYSMRGSYSTLENGFTEFSISAGRASEVTTSLLPALKIDNDSFVFFPFTENDNALLAMIPTETCPSADIRGNALFLESEADASDASVFWIASFRYDVSENQAEYSNASALDNLFSLVGDSEFTGGTCSNGTSESDNGDHYLTTRSSVVEIRDNIAGDEYTRTFSTRARVISDILDMDSESYIGFVHSQGSPDESYYVSASCDSGFCTLNREEEYDDLEQNDFAFELEFDQQQLNYQSTNGAAIGSIQDAEDRRANMACTLNSNLGDSATKLIMCNAQAPDDITKLVTIVLIDP